MLANQIITFFVSIPSDLPKLTHTPTVSDIPAKYSISVENVENKLASINTNKAIGPDEFPNWIIRDCAPFLSAPLASIYNSLIRESHIPEIWKTAKISPVPKVWSTENQMKLNESKTNEIVICFKNAPPPEPIVINDRIIERVSKTKLLGVIISNGLTWDLALIYFTTIRPVLEYACPVWHPDLNAKSSSQLENIQKRVFKIILPTHTYTKALEYSGAPTLTDRHSEITKSLK